jgi:hypothetical protein
MSDIDWKGAFEKSMKESLKKPPYVVLPGVCKPPDRLPRSAEEVMCWRRKNPRLLKWIENHASDPNYRPTPSNAWPDPLEEWDEEVQQLLREGAVEHEGAAMTWLYENDPEFKKQADMLFEEDIQNAKDLCKKQLFWKLNRAAWTALWSIRIGMKVGEESPSKKQRWYR